MEYDNTNSGAIFKNDKKTADNQPDYRGKIDVDGVEKQISLWVKKSKDGTKTFFSAKISEPYVPNDVHSKPPQTPPLQSEVEDDLPF
jgi:uncharacterized protein (DUF736 family)